MTVVSIVAMEESFCKLGICGRKSGAYWKKTMTHFLNELSNITLSVILLMALF